MKNRLILSMALLIFAFGTISATAQQEQQQVDVSPGVARISLAQGDVSTQRGDSGEWAAAVLNAPIVTGDRVSTGDNARAEVQLDFANILRLGDRTQATIANITRNQIQVQIGEGIANYDALKDADASAEIDTPNVSIRPDHGGSSFRLIVHGADETQVIVRRGSVDVSTPQGDTRVDQGQIVTIHGTGDDTAYKVAEAPPQDDWDSWINERNDRILNAKSWDHTDRYYTGSEDLDSYGQWKNVPDYGAVWVPAQGADWAPYRDGRWVWEPYYGWTWVPNEPWGWAPYHYGRWMYYDSAWAWWPGPVYAAPYYRPVWAPAYVSFFGFGGGVGFSVGFGFGSFGWLPCGPGDFYHPWWGGYRNNYNVVNITNVNVYNNRGGEWGGWGPLHRDGYSNVRLATTNEHIMRGISTLPAGGFGTGRVQARAVDSNVFRNGHLMTGNLPVVPSRESLSASNRQASMSTIRNGQEHFFGKARPGNVESFDRQASQVEHSIQNSGRFTPVRSGEQVRAQNGSPNPSQRDIPDARSRNSIAKPSPEVRNDTRNTAEPRTNEVRNPGNTNTRNNNGQANDGFTRFGQQNRGNTVQDNRGANGNQGAFGGRNVPRPPQSGQAENSRSTSSDQNGWHRFGDTGSQPRGNNGSFSNSGSQPRGNNGSFSNSGSQPRNNGGFNNSGSRDVARPSGSFGNNSSNASSGNRSVPRPPSSATSGSGNNGADYRSFGSSRGSNEPASRGGYNGSSSPSRSSQPNYGGGSSSYPSRGSQPNYGSFPSSRGSQPSYGGSSGSPSRGSQPSYGGSSGYPSRASQPSYGGSSGYPSRASQPSYGGYPSSREASPSYGGGRQPSYSQPSRSSSSRPPLDMRQPIVGGRSSGGSFGSYGGGSHGGGSSSHGSSGSSHGGGSPHSGGRGR